MNSSKNTGNISIVVAFLSMLAAAASAYFAWNANMQSTENQERLNWVSSIDYLSSALDKMGNKKNSSSIIINTGDLTEEEGARYEAARRLIEKAESLTPDYYLVHHYKGLYFQRIGNLKAAEESIKASIELLETSDEEDWWPYSDLGIVQAYAGKQKEAELSYNKALAIDSFDPRLRRNIAIFYAEQGDMDSSHEQWCYAFAYRNYINHPIEFDEDLICN